MSNALLPKTSDPVAVIVRGFRGEPKQLLAAGLRGQLVEVISLDKTAKICVSATDVFAFNAKLFRRLLEAYKAGGEAAVAQIWTQAKAYAG